MAEQRPQRQLSAILAADVAGYSRLIGLDEEGTLARLKELRRALIDPKINEHRGRIVKTMGDGLLAQFASAVDAVRCAMDVQRQMAEQNAGTKQAQRIEFRIGINVGDVVIDGDDIYGDGVNIAARLEALAGPGSICVSGTVHDQVRDKLNIDFTDRGEQPLKNITRPIRVYAIGAGPPSGLSFPTLPEKPSIAVLPFENLSGDREQEYFADGVVEEIITALSRFRQLFVIARNSSFTYKGRAVDVKQVGRELGVRYVLEGSVRKASNRLRITGQLIDTSTGAHIWAERFEGRLEDVFDLQDQMTASVVGAIVPKLEQAEIERSRRKPTENLDAYDCYLRGLAGLYQWTKDSLDEALSYFHRAIEIDPNFATAYGLAARIYVRRKAGGWINDPDREIAEVVRLARRAADLGKDDAFAVVCAGIALSFFAGEHEDGKILTDRAIALNPNLALGWLYSGWARMWLGEQDEAIERVSRALRLSPNDPDSFSMYCAMAFAHFFAGRYDEASSLSEQAAREKPSILLPIILAAASNAHAGRYEEAHRAMAQVRRIDPSLKQSNLKGLFPISRSEDFERWSEGLRKAGLPE